VTVGDRATNRPKIVAAASWTLLTDDRATSALRMILSLTIGHAARTDALDDGCEDRIAAHQGASARS